MLVRVITRDDAAQSRAAETELENADLIVLSMQALCELAWVLSRGYKIGSSVIASTIRRLIDSDTVLVDQSAVAAGLAMLDAGGDFADGVIAYEGRRLGADVFVSFDEKAVRLLKAQGQNARHPLAH